MEMTAEKLKAFKEELRNDFIPAVERLIEKEKKHLQFLKDSQKKLERFPAIRNFLITGYKFNEYSVDHMIVFSERHLRMLESRLVDYQDYVNA